MINWFTKKLTKKRMRIEFKRALRQQHYVDQQNTAFLVWKLAASTLLTVPKYRAWIWRSWYINKIYKQYQKKGFLLNLYFLHANFKPSKHQKILGGGSFEQPFWLLQYSTAMDKHLHLYNFLYKHLVEYKKLALDKFDVSWKDLRAINWLKLTTRGHFVPLEFTESQFEQYWLVEKAAHHFQYKIACTGTITPGLSLESNKRQLHPWIIKTLLLRTLRYPSLLQYKYLKLFSGLQYFGYALPIPWMRTLQEDGVWQADPVAVHLIALLPSLTYIYRRCEITEYLVKKLWQDFLSCDDMVSIIFKEAVPEDPATLVRLILRSLRLSNRRGFGPSRPR